MGRGGHARHCSLREMLGRATPSWDVKLQRKWQNMGKCQRCVHTYRDVKGGGRIAELQGNFVLLPFVLLCRVLDRSSLGWVVLDMASLGWFVWSLPISLTPNFRTSFPGSNRIEARLQQGLCKPSI